MLNLRQRQLVPMASKATAYFNVLITALFFAMDIAEAGYYDTVTFADCAKKGADYADIECFSFFATDNGKGDCAINDKNDPSAVVGPCDSNPCHFTGKCTPSADGKDFTCDCPPPMGGKTCEDLTCEKCFRRETLVVYMETSNAMTWTESYAYCASKGLTMFMDKSWTSHGFILGVINQVLDYPPSTFWMGLNRSSSSAPFTYVDGSVLTADSFTDWAPTYPAGFQYVSMSGGVYFRWKDESNSKGRHYFPICQATYDFLSHY